MAGVSLHQSIDGIPEVVRRLGGIVNFEMDALTYNIGALLEGSTKERIATGKEGPNGETWPDWSEDYAASRHGGHSLLMGEGSLLDSVQNYSRGGAAVVGTNLVYGAIHQFGGEEVGSNIPARPYVGMSAEDREEISDLVTDHMERIFG